MWQQLLMELLEVSELDASRIAEKIGSSREAVHLIRRGVTKWPHYQLGARLIVLHLQHRADRYQYNCGMACAFCAGVGDGCHKRSKRKLA